MTCRSCLKGEIPKFRGVGTMIIEIPNKGKEVGRRMDGPRLRKCLGE